MLKKAFLSHFFRTRSAFCVHVKAGLTIEAALAFPLLLFFLAVIASPLRLMEEQRKLQNRLEAIGKDISISAYLEGLSGELLNIGRTGSVYKLPPAPCAAYIKGMAGGHTHRHRCAPCNSLAIKHFAKAVF